MFERFIHFIKYNNATIFILVVLFVVGTSAFASETGREAIGQKTTTIDGVDNTLLLEADLDNLDMDFKIERIEEDDKYYYITYTFIELLEINSAWQYQLREKTRRISKKLKKDLGTYLAEEFKEDYFSFIKKLKEEQIKARDDGESKRVEVNEYSGLIGGSLNIASKIFDGYKPVKKTIMNSPVSKLTMRTKKSKNNDEIDTISVSDNLTDIYNDYIEEKDPDLDNFFGDNDNCPSIYNPNQYDNDNDGVGDLCDIDNIEQSSEPIEGAKEDGEEELSEEDLEVEIIDLGTINDNEEDEDTKDEETGDIDTSDEEVVDENLDNNEAVEDNLEEVNEKVVDDTEESETTEPAEELVEEVSDTEEVVEEVINE